MQESLLADPALLVDQLVLHHRDLPGRSAEGLQRDGEPGPRRLPQRDDVPTRGVMTVPTGWRRRCGAFALRLGHEGTLPRISSRRKNSYRVLSSCLAASARQHRAQEQGQEQRAAAEQPPPDGVLAGGGQLVGARLGGGGPPGCRPPPRRCGPRSRPGPGASGRVSASTGWTTPAPGQRRRVVDRAVGGLISRAIVWPRCRRGNRARSSAATPLTSAAAHDVATCWIRQVLPLRPSDTASYVGAATSVAELASTYCLMSPRPREAPGGRVHRQHRRVAGREHHAGGVLAGRVRPVRAVAVDERVGVLGRPVARRGDEQHPGRRGPARTAARARRRRSPPATRWRPRCAAVGRCAATQSSPSTSARGGHADRVRRWWAGPGRRRGRRRSGPRARPRPACRPVAGGRRSGRRPRCRGGPGARARRSDFDRRRRRAARSRWRPRSRGPPRRPASAGCRPSASDLLGRARRRAATAERCRQPSLTRRSSAAMPERPRRPCRRVPARPGAEPGQQPAGRHGRHDEPARAAQSHGSSGLDRAGTARRRCERLTPVPNSSTQLSGTTATGWSP